MMWFDDLPTERGSGWFRAPAEPFKTKKAAMRNCVEGGSVIKVYNEYSIAVGFAVEWENTLTFKDVCYPKTYFLKLSDKGGIE